MRRLLACCLLACCVSCAPPGSTPYVRALYTRVGMGRDALKNTSVTVIAAGDFSLKEYAPVAAELYGSPEAMRHQLASSLQARLSDEHLCKRCGLDTSLDGAALRQSVFAPLSRAQVASILERATGDYVVNLMDLRVYRQVVTSPSSPGSGSGLGSINRSEYCIASARVQLWDVRRGALAQEFEAQGWAGDFLGFRERALKRALEDLVDHAVQGWPENNY